MAHLQLLPSAAPAERRHSVTSVPDHKIEPPNEKDIENIAMGVVHAGQVIEQALGEDLTGKRADL